MDEAQILLKVLAMTDEEIQSGKTVSIEEVMAEFGVETEQLEPGGERSEKMVKPGGKPV
jgi:hypothetical protein